MDKEVLKSCSCPLDAAIAVIGGKYKLDIVYYLFDRVLRYSELAKLINATPKMLAEQLKALESDGIVSRKLYPVVPPKTEYSLTELGNKLCKAVMELFNFGCELYKINDVRQPCSENDFSRLQAVANKSKKRKRRE